MANRKLGCLTLFLFLALCASVIINVFLAIALLGRVSTGVAREEPLAKFREIMVQRGGRGVSDRIVVIVMRGLISSSIPGAASDNMVDDLRMALQQARDDDRVKGVVLEIDSPGGEVTASDIIYNAVIKTRARKPVVVYMDSLAASGGYYVSCGGKYLMANDTTITGSIGVIIQTLNYEQLFNKVGLASVVFKSGKFKDLLNGARPMTPEEREFVQNFVMKTYDKFLGIVAKERNLPADGCGEDFLSAVGSIANALFLIASVYIYVALLRQINRRDRDPIDTDRGFGAAEVALAVFLIAVFAFSSLGASSAQIVRLRTLDLILNAVVAIGMVLFVVAFLKLRRFNLSELTGLARLSFTRAFLTGLVLLIFAYPLIIFAEWLTARFLGSGSSRQGIIELFSGSQSMEQRVIIILLATAIAPVAEEFIFRFFLYGVLRRYLGRSIGLIVSALLFAAVHVHLPSFAPLFALGICFTLAYEWSGSLLVSMTMHAIFNAITLLALAFPETLQP